MTIKLFEVGGSIRDELVGFESNDRDFCAESPEGWEALLSWCEDTMDRVFLVTPEFLTVRGVMPNGEAIDVVMCRADGPSADGRHPVHVIPGTLHDDLMRRDFTINAMAREVDPTTLEKKGDIIDPLGGKADLERRILRSVGSCTERFGEDGLRVLRAARFCVTKGMRPARDVEDALASSQWWEWAATTVSNERIREELTKMFKFDTVASIRFLMTRCSAGALDILTDSTGIWFKPTTEKKK
jgi:tRNA nucleotidyltransferase/poly(A) polymerase